MNLNTGDFVVYKDKQDLDPNIFRFIREIKEVRISGERGCFLVSGGLWVQFPPGSFRITANVQEKESETKCFFTATSTAF
jgi:hypothetical protein